MRFVLFVKNIEVVIQKITNNFSISKISSHSINTLFEKKKKCVKKKKIEFKKKKIFLLATPFWYFPGFSLTSLQALSKSLRKVFVSKFNLTPTCICNPIGFCM